MKDEVFIKCLENSLWVQYVIEFFKFVGFSVSKDTYGDMASKQTIPHYMLKSKNNPDFKSDQVNIVMNNICRTNGEVKKHTIDSITVIEIRVDEKKFSLELPNGDSIRAKVMRDLLEIIVDEKQNERASLKALFEEYENHRLFYDLYNEGLLKYAIDYYSGTGKSNGLREIIKEACLESKKDFTDCYKTLIQKEPKDRYIRYAILLLKYKLNDLKYTIDGYNIFSSESILDEIEILVNNYPNFMRALHLAARICRSDSQFNYRFLSYIDRAIEVANGYSDKTKPFLYYEKGKYFEEHNYDIDTIYDTYSMAGTADKNNCFVLFKQAKYLDKRGETEEATTILKLMEQLLVDDFKYNKLMPKRRIHGFKCCAFLGNIALKKCKYTEAENYYLKSIRLALDECEYFDKDTKGDWKKIFDMCMPLSRITENLRKVYKNLPDKSDMADKLESLLYDGLEVNLRNYWKDLLNCEESTDAGTKQRCGQTPSAIA